MEHIGRAQAQRFVRAVAKAARLTLAASLLASLSCAERVHLGSIGDGGGVERDAAGDRPDAGSSSLLWSATFESGDLSEWTSDGNGGTFSQNVTTPPETTTEVAHTGRFSGKAAFNPRAGMDSLSYFFRQQPSPREAYYGAWFYVPPDLDVGRWVSLIHFRGSHTGDGRNIYPTWDLNLYAHSSGSVVAHLYNFVTQIPTEQGLRPLPVPLGTWIHFEVLLRKATGNDGAIAVWQDGQPILTVNGVATVENDWMEWSIGGAADDVSGAIYVDDATISLTRVGAAL